MPSLDVRVVTVAGRGRGGGHAFQFHEPRSIIDRVDKRHDEWWVMSELDLWTAYLAKSTLNLSNPFMVPA